MGKATYGGFHSHQARECSLFDADSLQCFHSIIGLVRITTVGTISLLC
jgi:hypothetical protein